MQKIKMSRGVTLTFEEGCNKYLSFLSKVFNFEQRCGIMVTHIIEMRNILT